MKPLLVLCLGNEVLSDDAFGFRIAAALDHNHGFDDAVDVIYSPLAGFSLLPFLEDRKFVLIVDAILTGDHPPGTIHYFPMGAMTSSIGLTGSHQINLPTAMRLGKELGMNMPENVDVLAVEVADVETLSENLTPEVESALAPAKEQINDWIRQKIEELGAVIERSAG